MIPAHKSTQLRNIYQETARYHIPTTQRSLFNNMKLTICLNDAIYKCISEIRTSKFANKTGRPVITSYYYLTKNRRETIRQGEVMLNIFYTKVKLNCE
jgi:hypothetical protein